jgi:hypothetical protein
MKTLVDRLLSPLMNQRGEVVVDPGADPNAIDPNAADAGIGGTGFKTPEELASGYQNLMKKLGEQGNELGSLRKRKRLYLVTLRR